MDRPARNRKTINYSDFLDDDEEDFATVKGPPNKKARASVQEPHNENKRETPSNSPKEMDAITGKGSKERVSLDEKLYKRDLEAALSLSLQQSVEKVEEPLTNALDETCQPPVLTHCSMDGSCVEDDTSPNHLLPRDSPPVLSNCSVDVSCLGLDQITSEQTPSRQTKTSKTRQPQERMLQDENDSAGDEDYKPQNTPESDADFSDESEDEEFTVKRKGEKKKTSRNEKKTAPKAAKKERNTPKLPKATQKSAGLDQIISEQTPSRQTKTSKTRQPQERMLQDENDSAGDEDYKPQNTPESDADFSDSDESEDEEFTVKRKGEKKKTSRNEKKTAPKAAKKERNTPKLPKATQKSAVSKTALSRSPGVAQSVPAQKRSPITLPMAKHALCSSPAGGRLPKWNPPGLMGNSPTSHQSAPVKSPGLGLRLGLSRLARVKPLHPNAAAH
ncbi:RAD51-associated protein 1 isoform X3 [Colossoma macropomum]|uniref:RAD51-associated protein 1 isoform X3 n=1 Tax=Colossoma macropomum TaxID=42526 RepID=UPI0018645541|nr:RAD51-associated protein 1 isoform X3 [Colossoma macropomum]